MALSGRKLVFVEEYLRDLNAAAAARRAGYAERTAKAKGYQLLREPAVAEAIAEAQAARSKRTQIDADWVLTRLAAIADSDLRRHFGEGGTLKAVTDLDDASAAALAGVEVVTVNKGEGEVEYVAKVKLWDKLKSLELLGRHLGIFKDRVDVEHSGGVTVVLSGDDAKL